MSRITPIRVKRTIKDFTALSSEHLKYGEPLYVKGTNGTYFVLGSKSDDSVTISEEKRLKFTSPSLADKVLYHEIDASGNIVLKNDGGTAIPLKFASPAESASGNELVTASWVKNYGAAKSHTHGNLSNDGKLSGNSRSVSTDDNGNIVTTDLSVADPTAEGTSDTFIKTISQAANGKITVTKATRSLPNYAGSASQGGAANSVKTPITFNNGGSGAASGTTFDGSAARTISYNTIGAAASSHTHNYAGSSSAGGAATNVNASTVASGTIYVTGVSGTGSQGVKYHTSVTINAAKGVLMGAAWNDFAEYRKCQGVPGTVVCEKGDGSLIISSEKLQSGANVISDTYGMVIGPQEDGYQPVAVAGRVLVLYSGDINDYKAGDAVCASKFGRIEKMTRDEIKEYPDRILGYVSEIPAYEEWNNVKVGNRLWIKVV